MLVCFTYCLEYNLFSRLFNVCQSLAILMKRCDFDQSGNGKAGGEQGEGGQSGARPVRLVPFQAVWGAGHLKCTDSFLTGKQAPLRQKLQNQMLGGEMHEIAIFILSPR